MLQSLKLDQQLALKLAHLIAVVFVLSLLVVSRPTVVSPSIVQSCLASQSLHKERKGLVNRLYSTWVTASAIVVVVYSGTSINRSPLGQRILAAI